VLLASIIAQLAENHDPVHFIGTFQISIVVQKLHDTQKQFFHLLKDLHL